MFGNIDTDRKSSCLLSVIIPCFNSQDTLQRTLRSLEYCRKVQSSDMQIILVDDGSTDRTKEIIAQWSENPEWSVDVIYSLHQGVSVARNKALAIAEGRFVLFLDSDDEICLDLLSLIRIHDSADAIWFTSEFRRNGHRFGIRRPAKVSATTFGNTFTAANPVVISSIVFRRTLIDAYFDEKLTHLEDWEFWLKNSAIFTGNVVYCDKIGTIVHIHRRNSSRLSRKMGAARIVVADRARDLIPDLDRVSANNLWIQAAIGRMQTEQSRFECNAFAQIPCDIQLYWKLICYSLQSISRIAKHPSP